MSSSRNDLARRILALDANDEDTGAKYPRIYELAVDLAREILSDDPVPATRGLQGDETRAGSGPTKSAVVPLRRSKPYYEDAFVRLYNGDCSAVLPQIEPVDLVLTDPPYNVGIHYGEGTDDTRPDYEDWCRDWFESCRRLAPCVALTPGVANVGLWHRIAEPTWTFAWHKPAAMGRCVVGFNNWEPILVWGKPQGVQANNDVVVAPVVPDPGVEGHPCPKPLKWAKGSLTRLCKPGGTVLDPFAGSGTTLRAAKDMGMRAVGVEVEQRFCELIARRLAQDVFDFEEAA